MSNNSQKSTKAETTVKKAPETAQNAPERVETPKPVSTPKPAKKTYDAAPDAALREQLLAGSAPEINNANGGAGGRQTIDEILHTYFAPTDLVTVKNPFDFDTGWVYSDPKDIVVEQPNAETRRVYGIGVDPKTGRNYQKTRILHAGESLILQGWEAYIGLTRFFKQWAQIERDPQAMNNMVFFREFMSKVFGGVYDPNASNNVVDSDEDARAALENDLGLTDGGNA